MSLTQATRNQLHLRPTMLILKRENDRVIPQTVMIDWNLSTMENCKSIKATNKKKCAFIERVDL